MVVEGLNLYPTTERDKVMVKFRFRRKIFNIDEYAFCSMEDTRKFKSFSDIAYIHSNESGERKLSKGAILQQQYTLETNLNSSEEELLNKIKKNCKYEIRRSEREEVKSTVYYSDDITEDLIRCFEITYNRMFKTKGLGGYSFNYQLVKKASQEGQLLISTCVNAMGENEIFHAYLCDGKHCLLMYSASPLWNNDEKEKANEIGRMNKYLHWKDILYFKEKNYTKYEWGGIANPEEPNGIDRFKMEFGGEIVQYNNYIIPQSLLGVIYTWLVRRRKYE